MANAQKYASQRNQEEKVIELRIEEQSNQEQQQQQPILPTRNNTDNPVGNTSPRHRKLVDKNVNT